ncbi:hypothetical protein [Vibrio metoecus]|uniref:hypothetical protein n=1 Tax=Vibrio metoecus TaxID=1481663 RepID=UPI0001B99A66|nr:hypothetical protein [Vibrio metoecus]EEX65976.1 hypothetical protein VCJ_001656 [Vibrio metoecus]
MGTFAAQHITELGGGVGQKVLGMWILRFWYYAAEQRKASWLANEMHRYAFSV